MTTNFRLARINDITSGYCSVDDITLPGQIASSNNESVHINGILAAVVGDIIQDVNGHTGIISNGRTTVKINGQFAAKIGSNFSGTYTGTVIEASPNVG